MSVEELLTCADEHLNVPEHRQGWLCAGPFYPRMVDESNLAFITNSLRRRFDSVSWCLHAKPGHATWIIVDPEDSELCKSLADFMDHIENEPLDEMDVEQRIGDAIHEEWEGIGLGGRVLHLLDAGESLLLALKGDIPDQIYENLREYVYESDMI